MQNRKTSTIIFMLAIVLLGVLVWHRQKRSVEPLTETKDSDYTVLHLNPEELPSNFPEDIPMEKGAKIIQNFQATLNEGKVQATRVFESQKSLDENMQIYEKYMENNNWTIMERKSNETIRALFTERELNNLDVIIQTNPANGLSTVNISYTYIPISVAR